VSSDEVAQLVTAFLAATDHLSVRDAEGATGLNYQVIQKLRTGSWKRPARETVSLMRQYLEAVNDERRIADSAKEEAREDEAHDDDPLTHLRGGGYVRTASDVWGEMREAGVPYSERIRALEAFAAAERGVALRREADAAVPRGHALNGESEASKARARAIEEAERRAPLNARSPDAAQAWTSGEAAALARELLRQLGLRPPEAPPEPPPPSPGDTDGPRV
jgi:hypothetical protein